MRKITITLLTLLVSMGAWAVTLNFTSDSILAQKTFGFSESSYGADISIGFTAFRTGDLVVEITDVFGRIIRKVNLGTKQPGTHAVSFSELNLESGNYLYIIRQDGSILHSGKLVKI